MGNTLLFTREIKGFILEIVLFLSVQEFMKKIVRLKLLQNDKMVSFYVFNLFRLLFIAEFQNKTLKTFFEQ